MHTTNAHSTYNMYTRLILSLCSNSHSYNHIGIACQYIAEFYHVAYKQIFLLLCKNSHLEKK